MIFNYIQLSLLPEAQDAGTIILTSFDRVAVLNSIQIIVKEFEKSNGYKRIPDDYNIDNTSWRVLKLISGNAKLSNLWDGVQNGTE